MSKMNENINVKSNVELRIRTRLRINEIICCYVIREEYFLIDSAVGNDLFLNELRQIPRNLYCLQTTSHPLIEVCL